MIFPVHTTRGVVVDPSFARGAWGAAVLEACRAIHMPCSEGPVPRRGTAEGQVAFASGVEWAGRSSLPGVVVADACPLWRAFLDERGLGEARVDYEAAAQEERVSFCSGGVRHADKLWLPPDREKLLRIMKSLGLEAKPWKLNPEDGAPVVALSKNPGGRWYRGADPIAEWIQEDNQRVARLWRTHARPALLRLHPKPSEGARARRRAAPLPPGVPAELQPPGVGLKATLELAACVDVQSGCSAAYAALSGVPVLPVVHHDGASTVPIQSFACRQGVPPWREEDMPDRMRHLAVLAAHSFTAREVREGALWSDPAGDPTGDTADDQSNETAGARRASASPTSRTTKKVSPAPGPGRIENPEADCPMGSVRTA